MYHSPDFIRVVKWGRMTWAECVADIGKRRDPRRVLVWISDGKRTWKI